MFEMFRKKGVSYVVDDEVQKIINIWLKETGFGKGSFGIILEKLGFNVERIVYLSRCSNDFNKIILKYSDVKNKFNDNNTITLLYNNEIELKKDDVVDRYECKYDKDVSGRVNLMYKWSQCNKENDDGVSYFRNIIRGFDDSTISIIVEDKNLDQGISINIKFDEMFYATFNIYNEVKLQNYLMSLDYPISIDEVYFEVCRILNNDLDVYDKISIKNYKISDCYNDNLSLRYVRHYGCESTEILNFNKKVLYVVERYDSKIEICVNNGDYKLYFEVDFNDIDEFGKKLDYEENLQRYLMRVEFPVSIEEIYKKICEISLGDVSKYSRIVLQCFDNSKDGKITDLIVLSDGNFEKFGMTKNGKTVFIDKYDNFTYKIVDEMTDFSVNIFNDDKIKCEVFARNDKCMNDYLETIVAYDISDAKEEKEATKKLVKKIFNKNDSN